MDSRFAEVSLFRIHILFRGSFKNVLFVKIVGRSYGRQRVFAGPALSPRAFFAPIILAFTR